MIRIFGLVFMGEEELLQMIHITISYLKTECDLKDREIAALRRSKEVVSE
jgi:hypothetical protein